jgi:hypothetical protein
MNIATIAREGVVLDIAIGDYFLAILDSFHEIKN